MYQELLAKYPEFPDTKKTEKEWKKMLTVLTKRGQLRHTIAEILLILSEKQMSKIKMDKGSEAHLKRLTKRFTKAVEEKYREGWLEHGGQLYKKAGMLKNAKDEVLDLWVYLDTLEEQLAKYEQGIFL